MADRIDSDDAFTGRSKLAVGRRLALSRKALGLNQTQFAERCGIHKNTYNQYEVGTNYPKIVSAFSIKDEYGLPLEWIYDGDNSELPHKLAEAIKHLHDLQIDH